VSDKPAIKKGDTVRHNNGQEGKAAANESGGLVMVKVKGTTQSWPTEECRVVNVD
jgi:hypothetical protein